MRRWNKRWVLAVAILLVLALVLSACGGNKGGGGSGGAPPAPSSGEGSGAEAGEEATGTEVLYGKNPFEYVDDQYDKSDWIKVNLAYADFLPSNNVGNAINGWFLHGLQSEMGDDYVNVTFYGNGQLLQEANMVDGLLSGTADIGMVPFAFYANEFPDTSTWIQPGMGAQSQTGGSGAFTEWALENQHKYEEYEQLVFLSGTGNGPVSLETKFPVNSVDDLKGKQIRTTDTLAKTVKAFGANPIAMPASETYEALRSGMVEGDYESVGGTFIFSCQEFIEYNLTLAINCEYFAYMMNRDKFNEMPPSQQEAFMKGWTKGFWEGQFPRLEELMILSAETIVAGAPTIKNLTFAAPGSELDKQFRAKVAPLLDEYKGKLDGLGYDGGGIVEEIREYIEKWDAWWDFDRENEFYVNSVNGTFDEWRANYKIPDNMPEHEITIRN